MHAIERQTNARDVNVFIITYGACWDNLMDDTIVLSIICLTNSAGQLGKYLDSILLCRFNASQIKKKKEKQKSGRILYREYFIPLNNISNA